VNGGPVAQSTAVDAAVARVRQAWGPACPDWVQVLALACAGSSQAAVAARLGYSPAVISQTLKGIYAGDIAAVGRAVRAHLMAETVECPVLGTIAVLACREHQRAAFAGVRASTLHVRLARECPRCPHAAPATTTQRRS
jgi:DNA-binding transcriptional regulator YdaS (Cro superfamily)